MIDPITKRTIVCWLLKIEGAISHLREASRNREAALTGVADVLNGVRERMARELRADRIAPPMKEADEEADDQDRKVS